MNKLKIQKSLQELDLDLEIIKKLNQHQINRIEELWKLKRKNLKEFGLTDAQIKHISIKLQLHSLDLNQKVYHRN